MRNFTIIAYVAILSLVFSQQIQAQEITNKEEKIEHLLKEKEQIEEEERQWLKSEVEEIQKRRENNEITAAEAEKLKIAAANKHARNIEDHILIIDKKIELIERNESEDANTDDDDGFKIVVRIFDKGKVLNIERNGENINTQSKVRDRRTYSDFVLGFGLNNVIIDGQSIDDSPYKIGGSRFAELGWAWKTRVFDNTNFIRIKYGISFQFNGYKLDNNQYFVVQGDQTVLQYYPLELNKSKFRMDNLVFPVHFEFGPSKKIERDDYFRYSTNDKFKIGLGGYAGVNIYTVQKLKYSENGSIRKDKSKTNFNTNNFIYGLSGYIAWGEAALYVKYDLNTVFKDNPVEQHNVSVGLRFDMD